MKPHLSHPIETPKVVMKRRLVDNRKEYLVGQKDQKAIWMKQGRSIMHEARNYDEAHKDILPYFPALFDISSKKVKIYCQQKRLQIDCNGQPVTNESNLTRNERVEILNELNKLFPVQVFESMYLQGVEKKRVENMIKEKVDE